MNGHKTPINTNNFNRTYINKLNENKTLNHQPPNFGTLLPDLNKYKTVRVNIDSRFRKKNPLHILNNKILSLPKNPLSFKFNSSVVSINSPDHGLTIEDKIILKNVVGENYYDNIKLTFYKNSNYVKIELDTVIHNLFESDKNFLAYHHQQHLSKVYQEKVELPLCILKMLIVLHPNYLF